MFDRKRVVLFGIAALLAALALAGCAQGPREERESAKLSREIVEFYLRSNPSDASDQGDHRWDANLDAMDRAWLARYVESCQKYRERLDGIDRSRLSTAAAVDLDVLAERMDRQILYWGDERAHERNPLVYTQIMFNAVFVLISRDYAPLEKRLDAVASRLEQFPRLVSEAKTNLQNPPKVQTELAIRALEGIKAMLREDLARESARLSKPPDRLERAQSIALDAVEEFGAFLQKDLINRSFGEARLGERFYRKEFELIAGTDESPEAVVAAAYDDIDLLQRRLFEDAAAVCEAATGERPPAALDESARRGIIDRAMEEVANDHVGPTELLDACTGAYAEAEAFVRERDLLTLPDDKLNILWAPEIIRLGQVVATSASGPLDRGRQYFFLVSRIDSTAGPDEAMRQLREFNNSAVRVFTVHEAMPGHFVHIWYANRFAPVLRALFANRFLLEGWGTYCEEMMLEEGFRAGDPRMRLIVDRYRLRYAVNAIVDNGYHWQNMQESEAIRFMVEEGFQSEEEALLKWRLRLGGYPVLYTGYYVGNREMRRLRDEMRERWGAEYSTKRFHERFLREGPISIKFVKRLLDQSS